MKIKMKETALGADDGFTVKTYEAGKEYEVGQSLGCAFVSDGMAVEFGNKPQTKPAPAIETQSATPPIDEPKKRRPGRPKKNG